MASKYKLADDLGDAGFGGHWAIEVSDDGEFYGDEYVGERDDASRTAARPFAWAPKDGRPFGFKTKKLAQDALRAVREAARAREVSRGT